MFNTLKNNWVFDQSECTQRSIYITILIKHGFFDQSECTQGPIYIINSEKTLVFDQSECTHAQQPIYIIMHVYANFDLKIKHNSVVFWKYVFKSHATGA